VPQLILVDKFTKLIPRLEYGYIEKYFPYGTVACGYPVTPLQKGPKTITPARSGPAPPASPTQNVLAGAPVQPGASGRHIGFSPR
jgi:hypothetical protein